MSYNRVMLTPKLEGEIDIDEYQHCRVPLRLLQYGAGDPLEILLLHLLSPRTGNIYHVYDHVCVPIA